MEEYLLDRETLEKFIDELMKKRPLPVDNPEELSKYKEEQMKALDDCITKSIFNSLTESQASELDRLLDNEQEDSETFQAFFHNNNIDLEKIITEAAESFGTQYLEGGDNE
mgnify:CR=1 FL=1